MDTIQPIDMIELKASLLVEGIRANETALTEVGYSQYSRFKG